MNEVREEVIYLTNLACRDLYPDNKPWAFQNILQYPINLIDNVSYELALRKFIFPNKTRGIINGERESGVIIYGSKESKSDIVYEYIPDMDMDASDLYVIMTRLNSFIGESLKEILKVGWDVPLLKYDVISDRVLLSSLDTDNLLKGYDYLSVKFGSRLARLLGFDYNRKYTLVHRYSPSEGTGIFYKQKGRDPPLWNGNVKHGIIYTDLVQPSRYGDTMTPVLDVFTIDNDSSYTMSMGKYLYKPVSKRYIDSVSVKISDETGNPIYFDDDGCVTVVLHIRPTV